MATDTSNHHMYVYHLPYAARKELCCVLDLNDKWEELGGLYMGFDVCALRKIGQAVQRNNSPTDELLTLWGTQNHTVLELFVLLSKMQHYQAMTVIKDYVESRYHRLLYEGEENLSRFLVSNKIPPPNLNIFNGSPKNYIDPKLGNQLLNLDHNYRDPPRKNIREDLFLLTNPSQAGAQAMRRQDETNICERASPLINYSELEVATNHWDEKKVLGKGGFGTVYIGVWKNTHVAVKRLGVQKAGVDTDENWKTHREQSLRELKYLNSCRHDNILPLYGYSIGGSYDCLVYQYMPNGSLEDRLRCKNGTKPLTWRLRHSIATGTARGLQFLHTFSEKPLVHGDIKSANILLDPYLEPKIGDFGLAREGPLQQYVKVSRVHGTRPYLPDEFLRAHKFSTKVDTFSFGIVLFELATGLRAHDDTRTPKLLKEFVESISDEHISEIRDSKAGPNDGSSFIAMINLGKSCVASKPKDRPEMVSVLQKLAAMTPEGSRLTVDEVKYYTENRNRSVSPGRMVVNDAVPTTRDDENIPGEEMNSSCGDLPLISELGIKSQPSVKSTSRQSGGELSESKVLV